VALFTRHLNLSRTKMDMERELIVSLQKREEERAISTASLFEAIGADNIDLVLSGDI